MEPIFIAIIVPVVSTGLIVFLTWILRKAIQDLKNQVTPNGGGSMYDKTNEAKDFARKALEVSVATEARLINLESKVDAIILSRLP